MLYILRYLTFQTLPYTGQNHKVYSPRKIGKDAQSSVPTPVSPRRDLIGFLRKRERVLFLWMVALIALLAFVLRAYDLEHNPPELFEDELGGIVGVWNIVTTGHDVEKTWLPFIITRLEFKQPLYFIATLSLHALFGPQVWAMRLPAVIFGVISVLLLIWLMRQVFYRTRPEALLAGALFAVVPWAVHYGRIAWEPAAFIPFGLAGVGLLWLGLTEGRPRTTVVAAAVLAVGAYTYHPALLMNAALALSILLINWRSALHQKGTLMLAAVISGVILLPYAVAYVTEPLFTYRTSLVTIFQHGLTPEAIGRGWRNYAEQWNPLWLFLQGDKNLRNRPGVAMTFGWIAPFLLIGIIRALKFPSATNVLLFAWFIVGPLPAGITNDGTPHFTRGLFALPPLVMLTAIGLFGTYSWLREKNRTVAITVAVAIALIACNHALSSYLYYYVRYPLASGPQWYYGTRSSLELVRVSVPQDGTVCIEEPLPVPYFTFEHYVTFYLPERDFRVVEGLREPACSQPGTYVLHQEKTRLTQRSALVGTVKNQVGKPLYELSVVR